MLGRDDCNLGIMFRREHAPEALPDFARRAEEAGFDELWVVEDCFYGSGIASAAVALACTERIGVGLGIMPAVARNPVFTAMEIGTLARLYPGRFLPGIGHGVAHWMHQIGAFPRSQMAALEEVTVTVRALLAGERVSYEGREVHLDQAELVFPPDQIPPISLGVRGPKSLAVSGRAADGTILAEYSSPAYVSWVRGQVEAAKAAAGHDRDHHLTVFSLACAGTTTAMAQQEVRQLMAPSLASGKLRAQLAPMGILPELDKREDSGGLEEDSEAIPGSWLEQLSIAGTAQDWTTAVDRLVEAGANSVVLVPLPGREVDELDVFVDNFLP